MSEQKVSNFINKGKKLKTLRFLAIAILGLVLFIAGGAVGGGTATILIFNHLKHRNYNPRLESHKVVQRLQHRLHLSKEQSAKVTKIISSHEKKISKLRKSAHSDIYEQIKQMRNDVAKVLNSKQRKKWLTFFDKMNRRWSPKYHHRKKNYRNYRHGAAKNPHHNQHYKKSKTNHNTTTKPTTQSKEK